MPNSPQSKYLSLKEIAKYAGYSQEYLSLRARQGRLRAIKIGRNWVTKKEWVDEYLEKVNNYKNQISNRKKITISQTQKTKAPELPKKTEPGEEITKPAPRFTPTFQPVPRARLIALFFALVFILGTLGVLFAYPYFTPGLKSVGSFIKQSSDEVVTNIGEFTSDIGEGIIETGENLELGIAFLGKGVNEVFNNLSRYITQDIKAIKKGFQILAQKIKQIPQKIVTIFKEKSGKEILTQEEIEKLITENLVTKERLEQLQQKLEKLKRTMTQLEDLVKANLYSENEDILRKIEELKK